MYQVKYDASLRTVLSNFRFTLWGPAPHQSLKNRISFGCPKITTTTTTTTTTNVYMYVYVGGYGKDA